MLLNFLEAKPQVSTIFSEEYEGAVTTAEARVLADSEHNNSDRKQAFFQLLHNRRIRGVQESFFLADDSSSAIIRRTTRSPDSLPAAQDFTGLPPRWETRRLQDGREYFVDQNDRMVHWIHPQFDSYA